MKNQIKQLPPMEEQVKMYKKVGDDHYNGIVRCCIEVFYDSIKFDIARAIIDGYSDEEINNIIDRSLLDMHQHITRYKDNIDDPSFYVLP